MNTVIEIETYRDLKAKLLRNSIIETYNIVIYFEDHPLEDILLSERALKLLGDPSPLDIMEDILDDWIGTIYGEAELNER